MINEKISILVPIYKVSDFIHKCVSSVINQTYPNWELILVDDGSPDNCPQICDAYAKSDNRIKVVHKANGGLASARNAGLSKATGDWIMMLDGDDWLKNDALEKFISASLISGADYIKFGMSYEYEGYSRSYLFPEFVDKHDFLYQMLSRRVPLCVWGGGCRKYLYDTLVPKFTDGLDFGEDYSVTPRLLFNAKKVHIISEALYCYRQNSAGYAHSLTWRAVEQLISAEKIISDYFTSRTNYYEEALKEGRYNIKLFSLSVVYEDYRHLYDKLQFCNSLYDGKTSSKNSNCIGKAVIYLSSIKYTVWMVRIYFYLRRLLIILVKQILG